MAWLLVVLLVTPLLGAMITRAYDTPGGITIAITGGAAALGIFIYLSPFAPKNTLFRSLRVVLIVMFALISALIRLTLGTPAYQPSLFAFSIFILAMLVMDGHPVAGVTAGLTILTGALTQIIVLGSELSEYLSIAYLLCLLLLAAAWAWYTKRLIKRGNEFDTRSAELLEQRRADARELTRLRLQNALTSSGANEVLERVASAETSADELVTDMRLAEASLRDHLSAPVFRHSIFTAEVTNARARGITVNLYGENAGRITDFTIANQLVSKLTSILRNLDSSATCTVRLLPDTTPAQFSVVTSEKEGITRYLFNEHGIEIEYS